VQRNDIQCLFQRLELVPEDRVHHTTLGLKVFFENSDMVGIHFGQGCWIPGSIFVEIAVVSDATWITSNPDLAELYKSRLSFRFFIIVDATVSGSIFAVELVCGCVFSATAIIVAVHVLFFRLEDDQLLPEGTLEFAQKSPVNLLKENHGKGKPAHRR